MSDTLPSHLDQSGRASWSADRTGVILAREYLRVSQDRSGEETSQEEQHDENTDVADDKGWTLGDPYRDTGSASEFAQKSRGDFDQLVKDLRADRFGAQVLIIWEIARLSREVSGWVDMIKLCAVQGIVIHVTSEEHTYDPANGYDRHKLIGAANDAQLESFKTSKRVRRTRAREKREGAVHGMIPYGYRREYVQVERKGKLVPKSIQLPHPDQAPVVQELFRRVLAGESVWAIAQDFARQDVRSTRGKPLIASWLREMLMRPVYAGLRATGPEIEGQWDGLVSKRDFYDVQAILAKRSRKTSRPGAKNVRLLSTIARCGVCDGPMGGKPRHGRDMYSCARGSHVAVSVVELDAYVTEVALAYLTRPGIVEELTAPPSSDSDLARALDDKKRCAAELADLERAVRAQKVSAWVATAAEEGIRERLSLAEKRASELSLPNPLRILLAPLRDGDVGTAANVRTLLEAEWTVAKHLTRREVLRTLLTSERLGRLVIERSPTPRQRCEIERRVTFSNE